MVTRFVLQPGAKIPGATLDQIEDAIDKLEDTDAVRVVHGNHWLECSRVANGTVLRMSWDLAIGNAPNSTGEPIPYSYGTVTRGRNIASRRLVERYGVQ